MQRKLLRYLKNKYESQRDKVESHIHHWPLTTEDVEYIDCQQELPDYLCIKQAGHHLSYNGLRMLQDPRPLKHWWMHPISALMINVVIAAKYCSALFTDPTRDVLLHTLDYLGCLLDPFSRKLVSIACLPVFLFLIISTVTYLFRAQFTWFGLFPVLRGEMSASQIGITNSAYWFKLYRFARLAEKLLSLYNLMGPFFSFGAICQAYLL